MTLNLSEMKDEPLGKHPISAQICGTMCTCRPDDLAETEQEVGAATVYHSSTFHVDGLSDEALDPDYSGVAFCTRGCWLDVSVLSIGA